MLKVADECWIGTALLHYENPKRSSFTIGEIISRIVKEFEKESDWYLRSGVMVHLNLHCLANVSPNPSNYRMLYKTDDKRRRLFKEGKDKPHEWRMGKVTPKKEDIPKKYWYLLAWYDKYKKK